MVVQYTLSQESASLDHPCSPPNHDRAPSQKHTTLSHPSVAKRQDIRERRHPRQRNISRSFPPRTPSSPSSQRRAIQFFHFVWPLYTALSPRSSHSMKYSTHLSPYLNCKGLSPKLNLLKSIADLPLSEQLPRLFKEYAKVPSLLSVPRVETFRRRCFVQMRSVTSLSIYELASGCIALVVNLCNLLDAHIHVTVHFSTQKVTCWHPLACCLPSYMNNNITAKFLKT